MSRCDSCDLLIFLIRDLTPCAAAFGASLSNAGLGGCSFQRLQTKVFLDPSHSFGNRVE